MTPEQKRYEAALKEHLAERARLLIGANQRVVALLRHALAQIGEQLAAQPADWQQWHLARLAGTAADQALRSAWQQGEDLVDKPLAAAGLGVEMRLAALDARVLAAMRVFAHERLANVAAEAVGKIGQQLGLVTIGAVTPFEAIKAVQKLLGNETAQRATTIVHTEVSRAFAVAAQERLEQAAPLVPGLQKQWRRSGKVHSRWNHDLIDGQVVDADKPFRVPNPGGGIDLMQCPHDPKAPPEQVIRCGCIALPFKSDWQVMTPGAKPFTERELRLDRRKAQLDQDAKRAGARREGAARPAYDAAQVPGATHHGYLKFAQDQMGATQLRKGIRSLDKQMADHRKWIADPASKPGVENAPAADIERWRREKWPADIERQRQQQEILRGVLAEKEKEKNRGQES